ncbi:MAG: NAD(P) transhydrogenase subunit alpha [Candidatus Kryptonium sp.]|nr:NAD(P) transhydrogenase subunit alpha [Candidatus Kryptonium sp.]MCX7761957.1 NAD(P) transhydrogenase subunit alpha [Candidatus Kryptonium sp.]MDW8108711.1 NAD(P) transhydrogenase subunit alpha [Candidatus Kryptonium sp.]
MDPFIAVLTIFVLAMIVGFEVITKVPPILHTPLMSGSNAISGITIIGSIIAAGAKYTTLASILGVIAVTFATINVVGGFLVTHRMLEMFQKPKSDQKEKKS